MSLDRRLPQLPETRQAVHSGRRWLLPMHVSTMKPLIPQQD